MKTYLLQIQTKDLGLQLLTEVSAATVSSLQIKARTMIEQNPSVAGMTYRIFSVIGSHKTGFKSEMLKEAVISVI